MVFSNMSFWTLENRSIVFSKLPPKHLEVLIKRYGLLIQLHAKVKISLLLGTLNLGFCLDIWLRDPRAFLNIEAIFYIKTVFR